MTDLDEGLNEIADGAQKPLAPADGRSRVDRIRQRHARRKHYLHLAIPEWDGEVVVRYGRLSKQAIDKVSSGRKGPTAVNADLLVAACREVMVRDEDTGKLHGAREGDGGDQPIGFDGRLADLFELGGESQRAICIGMYGGDDLALARHAKRVIDWQTGEDLDDAPEEEIEDLAGEADAAT